VRPKCEWQRINAWDDIVTNTAGVPQVSEISVQLLGNFHPEDHLLIERKFPSHGTHPPPALSTQLTRFKGQF